MKRFASSVQHITGQAIDIVAGDQSSKVVVEEELEVLRARVEELSDEVRFFPSTRRTCTEHDL